MKSHLTPSLCVLCLVSLRAHYPDHKTSSEGCVLPQECQTLFCKFREGWKFFWTELACSLLRIIILYGVFLVGVWPCVANFYWQRSKKLAGGPNYPWSRQLLIFLFFDFEKWSSEILFQNWISHTSYSYHLISPRYTWKLYAREGWWVVTVRRRGESAWLLLLDLAWLDLGGQLVGKCRRGRLLHCFHLLAQQQKQNDKNI